MYSVVVTGFRRHASYLSRLLNTQTTDVRAAFYRDTRAGMLEATLHILRADASITFGGPRPNGILRAICEARKRPAVLLWAGSDVMRVAESPRELEPVRLQNLVHWACSSHLVTELAELGVEARYVPVASAPIPAVPAPMPEAFSVLTYLPEPRRSFYGQAHVWEAARALPDVRFVVTGPGGSEPEAPPNVEYVGEVTDVKARIDASSVLLRIPEHDGLSTMVIEALARARHVIWTYPFPGVVDVASPCDSVDALKRLHETHLRGGVDLNRAGWRHVAQTYQPWRIAYGIVAALRDELAMARSVNMNKRSKKPAIRVAVSGHEVLSARVATNCDTYSSDFRANVLTTPTTSDTIVSALQLASSDAWYTIYEPFPPKALEIAARVAHKRHIVHWIGDEVGVLESDAGLVRKFQSPSVENLAQSSEVASRLGDLGLSARVVPVAAVGAVTDIHPMPQTFTLLFYLPAKSPEAHGRFEYERLMRMLAQEPVRFIVVGGGEIDVPAGVCTERIAWRRDRAEMYDRSSVFVRLSPASGIPTMVIESILRGRYVLCLDDVPFTPKVCDYDDLEAHVQTLWERHRHGALAPDAETANAAKVVYSPERCLHLLAEVCGTRHDGA